MEIEELRRGGMSVTAISNLFGYDRKTVRKYLQHPDWSPAARSSPGPQRGKLESFKPYLQERLAAGVWNAKVLLRELGERGFQGGYTILTDWLRPQRKAALEVAVRRFETPPGLQAQVDWGHLGTCESGRSRHSLSAFAMTLGYSRAIMAEAALNQKLGTLLRLHEEAFRQLGGVPEEILYDRMRTVWTGTDERGEVIWHPVFLDFARYWGFTPRLCRAYRPQTKGKVESAIKYIRRNFLCGLQGREPGGLEEFNATLRAWVWEVANRRIHGTTFEPIDQRWQHEREKLQSLAGRPPYGYLDERPRKVTRDAYIRWEGNRYSVPWTYAGAKVQVYEQQGSVEVHSGQERIARHAAVIGKHQTVTADEHHCTIPLNAGELRGKIQVHLRQLAPAVEVRSLAAYESAAGGGQ